MSFRAEIESLFGRWVRLLLRGPWWVIAGSLALSLPLIAQVRFIELETSAEGFLRPDDPTLLTYNAFRDQFDRDDLVLLAVRTEDVFERGFLERLRQFHQDLEAHVPQLEEIDSLINARSTRGDEDFLIVEDLFEEWPEDEKSLTSIRRIALANPLYRNLVLSEDGRVTTLALRFATYSANQPELDLSGFDDEPGPAPPAAPAKPATRRYFTGAENLASMTAVREVMSRFEAPNFQIALAGPPVLNERLAEGIASDIGRFLGLSIALCVGLLFLMFRTVAGTVLPLVVVLLSVLTTLGLLVVFGYPLQMPTQVLPALLLSVGIGDSVHVLAIFYQRVRAGVDKSEAIVQALEHSGLAILMTSVTTAGALMSFVTAKLAPVANLGVLAPVGVLLTFGYTVTLLPALLAVVPLRLSGRAAGGKSAEPRWPDRLLAWLGNGSLERPVLVISLWSGVILAAAVGASAVGFSHDPMGWFPEDDRIRVDTAAINRDLGGAMSLEVLVDTGAENGLHEPALLRRLEEVARFNDELEWGDISVGKTVSVVDVVQEIHQALNEGDPRFHVVPDDRRLVSQELLLFENSGTDDLEKLVDSRFQVARMTLRIPWTDAVQYPPFMDRLVASYRDIFGDGAEITITGRIQLLSRTFTALVESLARSYVMAFVVITPLMVLLLGSLRWGLLSMIPNVVPILITLGVMGAAGFAMDGFTLLVGSIALGLAVDDTIHFFHNFQRAREQGSDVVSAVRVTLATTGQALLYTTLVLCLGFGVFMLGSMHATFFFGALISLALSVALLADVTLVPALLKVLARDPAPADTAMATDAEDVAEAG